MDEVVFTFNPKNHTVTQSTFDDPCIRLNSGFDSGFGCVRSITLQSEPLDLDHLVHRNAVPIGTPDNERPEFSITVTTVRVTSTHFCAL